MKIAAFDLSLTATGWATWTGEEGFKPWVDFGTIAGGSLPKTATEAQSIQRIYSVASQVLSKAEGADMVLFEGLSYGSNDPSAQERAGLAMLIRVDLWRDGRGYILVPPTTLKKFATGKGNAPKEVVMREVFKRWGIEAADNNQADAVALLHVGMALAGVWQPTTKEQAEFVAKVRAA